MLISFLASLPALVQANYPNALQWSSCGGDHCATLVFCQDGDKFGYRDPEDFTPAPCGSKPGPLIRMKPGNVYKLTLQNMASEETNVHTHGLHIVGSGDSDDVTRHVPSGLCLEYNWDIASDHPPGTNWYHPHHHGTTADQVVGGAFGMIIIEDDPNTVGEWAHPDNELLLQISKTGPSSTLGNGNSNEVLQVEADKWYRLRVSIVTPDAKPNNVAFTNGCTIFQVAADGVWHNAALAEYSGSSFKLSGASRADFAIKCTAQVDISWAGKKAATLDVGNHNSGTGSSEMSLGTAPSKPSSLVGHGNEVPEANTYSISMSAAQINQQSWDAENPIEEINFNEVYEWTISGSGAHPFHLHLYHMLVVSAGGCGEQHRENEFYDTISAPGDCIVRFKTADFGQRMVMHCHVLNHEDKGAMVWMDVIGSPNQNTVNSAAHTCNSAVTTTTSSTTQASSTTRPLCLASGSSCSTPRDCCSGKCKQALCKGNRFLRVSRVLDD